MLAVEAPLPSEVEPSRAGHERRNAALDGLRGVAAFVVVIDHAVLATVPSLADAYATHARRPSGVAGAFYATPLHLLWAGQDAVLLFFVLSGYVLALPAVRRGWAWFDRSYYPRRLVRLYLPVWGALAAALAWHDLTPHTTVPGATWWLDGHAVAATARGAAALALLVVPASGQAYTTVLWSLRWEVLFSAALPLLLAAPIALRRMRPGPRRASMAVLACVLLACVCAGSARGNGYLGYLPVFVLGSLVAFAQAGDCSASTTLAVRLPTAALVTVGAVLLVANEEASAAGLPAALGEGLSVLGALALLVAATRPGRFSEALAVRELRWLGSRSYSLYLVHEPLLVALAFAWGGRPHLLALLAVGVPASMLLGEVFWRAVENPAITLARLAGRAVTATTATTATPTGGPAHAADAPRC